MPLCALPDHLKANDGISAGTGRDQDNRAQGRWRAGWTSFGWRCAPGWSWLYLPIPYTSFAIPFFPVRQNWRRTPLLLVGYNVARWLTPGDESEIFIPQMVERFTFWWQTRHEFTVTERKESAPFYNVGHVATLEVYGPSPIQRLRYGFSFVLTWPLHLSISYRRKRKDRADFVVFARFGARWDSFDDYFSAPAFFLGLGWN